MLVTLMDALIIELAGHGYVSDIDAGKDKQYDSMVGRLWTCAGCDWTGNQAPNHLKHGSLPVTFIDAGELQGRDMYDRLEVHNRYLKTDPDSVKE